MSEDSNEKKQPRPGFFSRLFTARSIENAEQKAQASIDEIPINDAALPDVPEEEIVVASQPEGFDGGGSSTAVPEKKSLFARFFGGAKKTEPATVPATIKEPVSIPSPKVDVVEAPKKSWFDRLRERLRKGTGNFVYAIRSAVGLSGKLDADTVERLEEILVASDVGMETALKIVGRMEKRARAENIEGSEAIMNLLKETLTEIFIGNTKAFVPSRATDGPYVVMVVGVNGVGKTTTIGKMAKRCRDAGLSVMLVAGDTFRAAAVEQLEIWSKRTGSDFMRGKPNSDPSGLAFDALKVAKARGIDVVFVDTAGRLQTKLSLMEELGKVHRVCAKVLPDAPHDTLLVIDATTGQNAVNQVKAFSQAVRLTGLVMTKLDGTAKGGILLTIRDQFTIPISLVGVGEGVDDLRDFDPEQFAAALFSEEPAN